MFFFKLLCIFFLGIGFKMLTLSTRNRATKSKIQASSIDFMLDDIGLIRHVVPRDGNSLFRCISQCVFYTQSFHMIVRKHLLQFANFQTSEFSQMTHLSVGEYANKITKFDGELLDLHIAAKVYSINVSFYTEVHPFVPQIIKTPNAARTLNICLNCEGTYDLVLIKESVVNKSFCQAIVYEILYNNVFKLSSVNYAVNEMLFVRNLPPFKINDSTYLDLRATCTDMRILIELGITPFPFKVAKALTHKLYRNTEYDIWINKKREKFHGRLTNWQFNQGSKCIVLIDNQEYLCYIQNISKKSAPVEVYVKDLGQRMFVKYDQLKLFPVVKHDTQKVSGSPLVPYNNARFIHGPSVKGILPGQVFPPCYVNQYHHPPNLPMTSINTSNDTNAMHPWYVPTSPLPKDSRPNLQEHVSPSNFMDSSLKNSTFDKQLLMPQYWHCDQQRCTSCSCQQCESKEETNMVMDFNQPLIEQPGFDVPAYELQQ